MEDIVSKVENMIMEQGFLEEFKIKTNTCFSFKSKYINSPHL